MSATDPDMYRARYNPRGWSRAAAHLVAPWRPEAASQDRFNFMDAIIRCRGLHKAFGEVQAVRGLDLDLPRGACLGLLGPNGAGKTTTIEILEGLTEPDAGDVRILGQTWREGGAALRARVGLCLQTTELGGRLTVSETLRLFRSFYPRGAAPEALIARFSLGEKADARVTRLSGGQRQRLALACALIGEPDLLFLDEPTTGLDPQCRLELWGQIQRFREGGGSVLLTTHFMDEAERLCDRVAIVDHGRLIAEGTPTELIASLGAPLVIELAVEPELPQAFFAELVGVREVVARPPGLALAVESLALTVPALISAVERAGARLTSLSTHRATLEDVFVHLTGRHLRDA